MSNEDKALFVRRLNDALIECGAGRYDRLVDTPLTYEKRGSNEIVACGGRVAAVTGDSLTALAVDVFEQLI